MRPMLQELVLNVVVSVVRVVADALQDLLGLVEALSKRFGRVVPIQHDCSGGEVAKAAARKDVW